MIDIDLSTSVSDGTRRFDLAVRFAADAPVVALYGPSGAGKSLTLQSIAGLQRPTAGHVRIGGRTLFDARRGIDLPAAERGVGYLFQNYALFPHLSVRENVAFGLTSWWRRRLSGHAAARVDALLQSFGLAALAHSRPATLSGGQQQRVALARALACEPALLLLDEPFAALNPMLRQELRAELARVCARWRTPVVMITHDIDDVLALADVAFVIEQGQVVREVDVRRGEGREMAQRLLSGCAAAPVSASQRAVRTLLGLPEAWKMPG
jgi:molybdate transport system ATP-binding protein